MIIIFLRRRRLQRGKEGGGRVWMELDGLVWMEATFKL